MTDHCDIEAAYVRLINRGESLLRAIDRLAEQPALRDTQTLGEIDRRLRRLGEELEGMTGVDSAPLLPASESPTPGELFTAGSELVGSVRAAAWWHDEHASRSVPTEEVGAGTYL